jgi:hypothetical protein
MERVDLQWTLTVKKMDKARGEVYRGMLGT